MNKAIGWIGTHPMDATALLGKKILLFFLPAETDQNGFGIDFMNEEYGTILRYIPLTFPLLFFAALFGFVNRSEPRRRLSMPLLFILAYIASIAIFFVNGRLRVPVMPLLILLAAHGIDVSIRLLRQKSWPEFSFSFGITAVIFFGIYVLQPRVEANFSEEYLRFSEIAFQSQSYAQSEEFARRSIAQKETSLAYTSLANALAVRNAGNEAIAAYEKALQLDSSNVLAYFNFGNFALRQRKYSMSAGYWKRALQLNPEHTPSLRNLGMLYLSAGKMQTADSLFALYFLYEKDPAQKSAFSGTIEAMKARIHSGAAQK